MKQRVKNLAMMALNSVGLLAYIQLRRRSPLAERGWFRSFRRMDSTDQRGNPVPWLSYAMIDLLEERVRSDMTVLEYGSGNSTVWWAKRVRRVVSVEHHPGWYENVSARLPPNASLIFAAVDEGDDYEASPLKGSELFDVVVIDGRKRVECARRAVSALKPDGVIIWDDMKREEYRAGREFLTEKGFRHLIFSGMGPGGIVDHGTCVFYRSSNCLGI